MRRCGIPLDRHLALAPTRAVEAADARLRALVARIRANNPSDLLQALLARDEERVRVLENGGGGEVRERVCRRARASLWAFNDEVHRATEVVGEDRGGRAPRWIKRRANEALHAELDVHRAVVDAAYVMITS